MHHFRKYLTRAQILTVPNFMSLFRLLLVPFIVWVYWREHYQAAAGLVLLSGLTDVLDGFVARKFSMISDLGKMLDPICDKLTHGALLLSLVSRYRGIWLVFGLLAVKELTMLVLGSIAVKRRGEVHGAKWFGKLSTVIFETVMTVLILFPTLPLHAVAALLSLCSAALLFSFVMYVIFFLRLILSEQ